MLDQVLESMVELSGCMSGSEANRKKNDSMDVRFPND
jgi:hypothetical protein